jgi:flagellar hook-associated protein 2
MATSSTTSTTSGSSIDVNAIVSGLMTIERQPITKLNNKQTSYQAKLTAIGLIKSKLDAFRTAVKNLNSPTSGSFNAYTATPSDPSVLTASATNAAIAGTYAIEIATLAQSQKLVTAGQTSSTAAIGDGTATTITFDFGTISGGTLTSGTYTGATFTSNGSGAKSITIDSSNNTLAGIRDAINAAKMGVSASIVNDGSGTPYRIALSSDNSGLSNSLKITTSGGDGTLSALLANDPAGTQNLNQTVAAQNASFKVNGIQISKTSNSVTDAIQGVTLTLNNLSSVPVTLTVAPDTASVNTSLGKFVTAYNDLYSAMKNSSAYKSGSSLEGDAMLRDLQAQMRNIANNTVSGGTLTTLEDAGLSYTTTGTLQLDSAKLKAAMAKNFGDVVNLFTSATGYATKFDQFATQALAFDGTIATKTNSINQSIKNISDQISSLETRLARLEKQYRTTYSNLDLMLGKMAKTSAYLTHQLG